MDSLNGRLIRWGHSALALTVNAAPDKAPSLVLLEAADSTSGTAAPPPSRYQPLAEIMVAGEGRTWSGTRSISSAVGERLRYTGHEESTDGRWLQLQIEMADPQTGLSVAVTFRTVDGVPAFQTTTTVTNEGDSPTTLHSVSSFVTSAVVDGHDDVDATELHWAKSEWLAESRWACAPIRELDIPDLDMASHGKRSRGCFAITSTGSWSTSEALPTAVLVHRHTSRAWAWQIEHNGAWRWEIGECADGLYIATSGPSDTFHQWQHVLDPGESFTSVPVGFALSTDGLEGAAAALTAYRRQIVREHPDRAGLPVIFNDYMNTLMGNPTSEALEPLIDAAGRVGAEYFCIDAGWHDDSRSGSWAKELGAWIPSTNRFSDGLGAIIERIRAAGMVPGLWLEPEVVGLTSPVADELPDEAFFLRDGRRQVEDGRYHLDLRHPAALDHLDGVIDRLVDDLGIGYFKFDYNIDSGPGTEVKAAAPGAGLLGHNRAYQAWLDGLLDRHPGLVIENCGSGAMRMDYGILARTQLQSTSDQQNLLLYPPIAAAAPMSILPEQAGNWAYPQPNMSPEEIAFCMVTGMSGRLYQSGHLDGMTPAQLDLVASGVATYKAIRRDLARSLPVWPLGLPGWGDPWVALALRASDPYGPTHLALWRRPGAPAELTIRLPHLVRRSAAPTVIYPTGLDVWATDWDDASGTLTCRTSGPAPAARMITLSSAS